MYIRQRGACAPKRHFHVRASAPLCGWLSYSCGTAAGAATPLRSFRPKKGATPPVDALVMAWAGAGFHKPRTASGGVAPGPMIPGGKAIRVPPTGGLMGLASGSALTGRMRSTVVREAAPMPELVRAPTGRLDFGAAPRCMNPACSASRATLVPRGPSRATNSCEQCADMRRGPRRENPSRGVIHASGGIHYDDG